MKKLDILFVDWGLSRRKIEEAISSITDLGLLNFANSIRKELKRKSELSTEIKKELDSGELLSDIVIEKLITQDIRKNDRDLILTAYPRTPEQFVGLQKILLKENRILNKVWFFKLKNQNDFMEKHFENPSNKKYLEKHGNEVITDWSAKFEEKRKSIDSIRSVTESIEWKNIEMEYVQDLSAEYLRERIKDCA